MAVVFPYKCVLGNKCIDNKCIPLLVPIFDYQFTEYRHLSLNSNVCLDSNKHSWIFSARLVYLETHGCILKLQEELTLSEFVRNNFSTSHLIRSKLKQYLYLCVYFMNSLHFLEQLSFRIWNTLKFFQFGMFFFSVLHDLSI